jgi:hypothetical protein
MSAGIRAGSSNDGYVQVNGNDIITALSGGNVGIGVSSPSTKLHVNGTITATNFAGSGGITTDDWIVHAGDTDTKLGFPAADQIQFDTGGTNYLKLHRYSSVNFVEVGSGAHISLAANGANSRGIMIGDGNASSTGQLFLQAGGGSTGFGGGIRLYSHANSTNAGGVYIGKSLNSSGSIIFGNGGTTPSHEYLKINSSGKSSFKSQGTNTVCISLLDNDSTNEIWRVGQAADGDGYVEVLEDGGTVGCKLDASGNSFTMGNFGVGVSSPNKELEVRGTDVAFRLLSTVATGRIGMEFYDTSAQKGYFGYASSSNDELSIQQNEDADFWFYIGGGEKLRITTAGKIGIGHHSTSQIDNGKEFNIRPANDGGIRLIRPGDNISNPNIHLDITTTSAGSAFPSGEAYTVKYKTMNCDQIFETYAGGGTGGNISFRTSTSNNSRESLRITPVGDIAIGGCAVNTFSNYQTLTIGGARATTGVGIDLERNDGNIYGRFFADANGLQIGAPQSGDYIRFELQSNERTRITENGQIGVNYAATPPSETIHISSAVGHSAASVSLSHLSGGNRYGGRFSSLGSTDSGVSISSFFNSSYVEKVRISGHSSACNIKLYNQANQDASATCEIQANHDIRDSAKIVFGRENADDWSASHNSQYSYLGFYTRAGTGGLNEKLRIHGSGRVGINCAGNSRGLELNVGGNAGALVLDRNGWIASFIRASDGGSNVAGSSGGGSKLVLNKNEIYMYTFPYTSNIGDAPNFSQRFRIDTSGNFHGSSSSNISDQRLKKDIATITNPLTKIKGLTGRTFKWKEDSTKFDDETKYGFVAQEVETILPDLVDTDHGLIFFDKDDKVIYDEDAAVSRSKAVNETGVIPIAVEALKELIAKVETLESKVAALEGS